MASWTDAVGRAISDLTDNVTALGAALTAIVIGLGGALMKARRDLARQNSEIKIEKSDAHAGTWLNQSLMQQVAKAETERDATMRAAKELLDLRMVDVAKIARLEEQVRHLEKGAEECQDRAQRAETRAAVAEEHMRKQTEQMLMQSINIDRLTTELAKHDKAAADRLSPKPRNQPLLMPPDEGDLAT